MTKIIVLLDLDIYLLNADNVLGKSQLNYKRYVTCLAVNVFNIHGVNCKKTHIS